MSTKRPSAPQPAATQKAQTMQQPVAAKHTLRKRRFPWAQLWVWVGVAIGGGFMVGFVLKVLV